MRRIPATSAPVRPPSLPTAGAAQRAKAGAERDVPSTGVGARPEGLGRDRPPAGLAAGPRRPGGRAAGHPPVGVMRAERRPAKIGRAAPRAAPVDATREEARMAKPILVGYDPRSADRAPVQFGIAAARFTGAPLIIACAYSHSVV